MTTGHSYKLPEHFIKTWPRQHYFQERIVDLGTACLTSDAGPLSNSISIQSSEKKLDMD